MTTAIEWTHFPDTYSGETWNPVTGCSKVSEGCRHCFAETIANRFWKDRKFTDVQTHADRLAAPLKRRKPTTYFVNSMSDLFHEDVPVEFICEVFAVMAIASQHRFIVLTKRPENMLEDAKRIGASINVLEPHARALGYTLKYEGLGLVTWPLPNVILGVSVENQATADERIPLLLQTPAATRLVSYEPALGPVDFKAFMHCPQCGYSHADQDIHMDHSLCEKRGGKLPERLHWIIAGGESGHGARPCNVEWIRGAVEQCRLAGVACFVKQLGDNSRSLHPNFPEIKLGICTPGVSAPKGGDPSEWPEDLRVREFPK